MINKDELIKGTLEFIKKYKRLPYLPEDDIEVEKQNNKGEVVLKPYRTGKYIKEFFGNQDKYSKYLLDNKLITHDTISEIIRIDKNKLECLLNGEIKTPEIKERRQIELFFNKDYFIKQGKYTSTCSKCSKGCKNPYWVDVISCSKYKEKNKK